MARILGKILKNLGYLSEGQFIEASRVDLVAPWLGQTAPKTKEKIDQAEGGVLFIDEAYALSPKNRLDMYGQEAIATLVKEMEDRRENMSVIVAGYPDEMKEFIDSNPGLASRFTNHLHFESFSTEDLIEIFTSQIKANDYFVASSRAYKAVGIILDKLRKIRRKLWQCLRT